MLDQTIASAGIPPCLPLSTCLCGLFSWTFSKAIKNLQRAHKQCGIVWLSPSRQKAVLDSVASITDHLLYPPLQHKPREVRDHLVLLRILIALSDFGHKIFTQLRARQIPQCQVLFPNSLAFKYISLFNPPQQPNDVSLSGTHCHITNHPPT